MKRSELKIIIRECIEELNEGERSVGDEDYVDPRQIKAIASELENSLGYLYAAEDEGNDITEKLPWKAQLKSSISQLKKIISTVKKYKPNK